MRLIQDISSVSLSRKKKELLQTLTKHPKRKVEESSGKRAIEKSLTITLKIKIKTIKTRKMEIKTKVGISVGVETKTSTNRTKTVIIPNSPEETRKKVEIKRRMK